MSNSSHKSRNKKGVSLASLQYIEKIFGSIVCALLHLPAQLTPKPRNMDPAGVKKLLIIKFFGIGSLVLAEPLVRKARHLFPNAEIHVLTLSSNAQVMGMIPGVDRVRLVDLGGNIAQAIWAYLGTMWVAFRGRYDAVLDLEFYTRASAVVSLASWSPVRVGYHAQGIYRGDIQNFKVPFNAYWHVSRNFLSLLEPWGYDPSQPPPAPKLAVPENELDDARQVLDALDDPARYVVINVNAGELAYERRWFPERFAELAAKLTAAYGVTCVFIGAASERDYVEAVVQDARTQGAKAYNSAGELSLAAMAQVCRKSLLMITNDSGPLHVAAAAGATVAGFFGPETPVLYGPAGDGHLVFHQKLACSPCIHIEQGKRLHCLYPIPKCQEQTAVDDVFAQIADTYGDKLQLA